MTDDKGLVDAYSSMYKKDDENLKEEPITATILATKAAMAAKGALAAGKAAKVGAGLSKAAKVAGKVGAISQGAGDTVQGVKKVIGRGQQHPDKANEDVKIDHLDGSTTEIIDVVPAPKMKGTEELKEEDAALEERLWDQVAANLTTLGEMTGVQFKVVPLEEKKDEEKKDKKDDEKDDEKDDDKPKKWFDDDGDGKGYEDGEVDGKFKKKKETKEGFNVKSPVIFSKKEEEIVEDNTELVSKYASKIMEANALLEKRRNK